MEFYNKLNPDFDPDKKHLPPYLGYGKLNQDSVKRTNGCIEGRYYLHDQQVYNIHWNDRCDFTSCYDEELISITTDKNLSSAFQKNWLSTCMMDSGNFLDPRMVYLAQAISKHSIYFKYPQAKIDDRVMCYFPAGKIFDLMIPVRENYLHTLDVFRCLMEDNGQVLSTLEENIISLLTMDMEGKVSVEEVRTISFSATLSRIYDAAILLESTGLLLKIKKYALFIRDAVEAMMPSLFVQYGDIGDGYQTYGILEKQLYEQCRDNVKNDFISNSRNILEQVLTLKSS